MKTMILTFIILTSAHAWAQNATTLAVCTVLRVDVQTEQMVRDTVTSPLYYRTTGPGTLSATAILNSGLMPSYRIEFSNVSGGRADTLNVRSVRKSNGQVMSRFGSRIMATSSRQKTSESAYVARVKNIFLSDSDRYILDITCYEDKR